MSDVRHVQSPLMSGRPSAMPAARTSPLRFAICCVVGLVFIYAGVLKALDPVKFASDIGNFHILPYPLAVRFAFYLPWLEILCGVALVVGWLRSGATMILAGLMAVFITATVAAKVRGINLDCGCFGSATKNLTFTWHVAIDLALLGALLALWFWPSRARRSL
ncbi:MAG: DoxX family membrane protein [Verrucomicrobiota bacterium]|nr:DoxX family membrane protein [Verrucomicrobiota bacterium]